MRFKLLLGLLGVLLLALWQWGAVANHEPVEADSIEQEFEGASREAMVSSESDEDVDGQEIEGAAQRTQGLDPSLLPDTIWVEGTVTYPLGFTPAADTRVWGRGAEWPDGEKWYAVKVSPGGDFRMAFAQGTEIGRIELQDPNCWVPNGSYRVWQKGTIELDAQEGFPRTVQVVGDGVDLDTLGYSLVLAYGRHMPLIANEPHEYRFAMGDIAKHEIRVEGVDVFVPHLTIDGGSESDAVDNQLVIGKPARIVGRMNMKGAASLAHPWLEVFVVDDPKLVERDLDSRLRRMRGIADVGFSTVATDTGGAFELEVSPGALIVLTAHGSGSESSLVRVEPLQPGQVYHLSDIELPPTSLVLHGQLVDIQGTGISNAWIRAGENWNLHGTSLSDPARCSQHLVQTDGDGRFQMRHESFEIRTIAALVGNASQGEPGLPIDVHGDTQIQHFSATQGTDELQTFVFNPASGGLFGSVKDAAGRPMNSIRIEAIQVDVDPWSEGSDALICSDRPPESSVASPYSAKASKPVWNPFAASFDPSIRTTIATSDGQFHWSGLHAGRWRVAFSAPGHVPVTINMVEVPNKEALNVVLHPTGSVRALVRDYEGKPRAGVEVVLRPLDLSEVYFLMGSNYQNSGRTGEDGIVLLEDVEPGNYSARFRARGARASASADVEVLPGQETEVVLQPKALGSVVLVSPWPDSPLGLSAHLRNTQTDTTYPVSGSAFNQPLFKRDLPPGSYRLSASTSGLPKGARERLEYPLVEVKAGMETSVDLKLRPGFQHVTGRVYVNGEQVDSGRLVVNHPGKSGTVQVIKLMEGGSFYAVLPIAEPAQVAFYLESDIHPVSDWPVANEGQEWRIDVNGADLWISLTDSDGRLVSFTTPNQWVGYLNDNSKNWKIPGRYIDGAAKFHCIPDGSYDLELASAAPTFPWHLMRPMEVRVEGGAISGEAVAVVQRAHPVSGSILFNDWPERRSAYVMAWSDSKATDPIGSVRQRSRSGPQFELYGPKPGPFWLSVELRKNEHHPHATVYGPFQMTDHGLQGIELKAHAPK